MKYTVLCVGKLKERYWREAVAEYQKRLSAYVSFEMIETPDEKAPEKLSAAQAAQVKEKEAQRLLKYVGDQTFLITLEIGGKAMSSEALSAFLQELPLRGKSQVAFAIGGSLGLGEAILARSDYRLSFSPMTFPHQLMRVILLEQIYRSYRIIQGEPYHK